MLLISLNNVEKSAHHSHAHRLLRECLRPFGIDYREEILAFGGHGKPCLPDFPGIQFNLSHARGIAACIVSDRECGIDCEPVRECRPGVMRRAFSGNEQQLVENLSPEHRDLLFFRLWTLKEAYIKAIGLGLSYPMNKAEFTFSEDGTVQGPSGYRFRQYLIKGKYVVSVCEKE